MKTSLILLTATNTRHIKRTCQIFIIYDSMKYQEEQLWILKKVATLHPSFRNVR